MHMVGLICILMCASVCFYHRLKKNKLANEEEKKKKKTDSILHTTVQLYYRRHSRHVHAELSNPILLHRTAHTPGYISTCIFMILTSLHSVISPIPGVAK